MHINLQERFWNITQKCKTAAFANNICYNHFNNSLRCIKMKKLFLLFIPFILFAENSTAKSIPAQKQTDNTAKIEKSDSFLKDQNFTGSVLIAKGDKVLFSKGYGTCNKNDSDTTEITPDTRFEIGSISKQITASTVMQLVEKGLLSVDDKLSKFFPDYVYGNEITIKNLLTMRSGTENFYLTKEITDTLINSVNKNKILDIDFWIDELNKRPLASKPGQKYNYDNLNYYLLAKIVEQVTGIPHDEYIQKNIFDPLEMNSSNLQTGMVDAEPYDKVSLKHFPTFYSLGAGDINSTVNDLFKWIRAFVNGKIVNENSIKEMTFNRKDDSPEYGYGFMYNNNRIYHIGSTIGYNSMLSYNYDNDLTIIVLCNRTERSKSAFTMEQVLNTFWK